MSVAYPVDNGDGVGVYELRVSNDSSFGAGGQTQVLSSSNGTWTVYGLPTGVVMFYSVRAANEIGRAHV